MRIHINRGLYLRLLVPFVLTQAGCQNVLGFSTATKFGLDISQRPDQTIDVSMGYDRTEVASIPAPKNEDATQSGDGTGTDTYSVLGTFVVFYGNPFLDQPLVLNQFFATGMAARKAAKSPELQRFFGEATGKIAAENKTSTKPGGQ
ncbi:MAG: hypothetical protein PHD43_20535 [Methylococcales bacterium]|nr:hypothetical protein [Methylococcales bacterium]